MDKKIHFSRKKVEVLKSRLLEPLRFLQIVSGPRQSGKTTLIGQVVEDIDVPCFYLTAEEHNIFQHLEIPHLLRDENPSSTEDMNWIVRNWNRARQTAKHSNRGSILIFDEIQKINNWSEVVKALWDIDRRENCKVRVVLLRSAPLFVDKGNSDSLMGRFEIIKSPYWSYPEMSEAFGFNLDEYIFYGGFPGAVPIFRELERWSEYIHHAIVHSVVNRDICALTQIDEPALLKQLLELSVQYSGQILSYDKLTDQLHNAKNATTIENYLDLLLRVGLVGNMLKFTDNPTISDYEVFKLYVRNTGLMSAPSRYSLEQAKENRTFWGQLVDSSVGAHLLNTGPPIVEIYYWKEKKLEVDFVLKRGPKLVPVIVKSGDSRKKSSMTGLDQFKKKFNATGSILVGQGGVSIPDFLSESARYWVEYSEYP